MICAIACAGVSGGASSLLSSSLEPPTPKIEVSPPLCCCHCHQFLNSIPVTFSLATMLPPEPKHFRSFRLLGWLRYEQPFLARRKRRRWQCLRLHLPTDARAGEQHPTHRPRVLCGKAEQLRRLPRVPSPEDDPTLPGRKPHHRRAHLPEAQRRRGEDLEPHSCGPKGSNDRSGGMGQSEPHTYHALGHIRPWGPP